MIMLKIDVRQNKKEHRILIIYDIDWCKIE